MNGTDRRSISDRRSDREERNALDRHKPLGNSGLRVSPLCLVRTRLANRFIRKCKTVQGTMTFGTRWVRLLGACTREEAELMFNDYVAKGGMNRPRSQCVATWMT